MMTDCRRDSYFDARPYDDDEDDVVWVPTPFALVRVSFCDDGPSNLSM